MVKKIIAIVTTVACLGMVAAPSASAVTIEELQAQIAALMAQIATLQGGSTTGGTISGVPTGFTFTNALKQGMSSDEVKYLQIVLNSDVATQVAATGVGSAGNETMYFGSLTKAAVIKFQEKYASEILAGYGLTSGTGYVGTTTRAKLNALLAAGPTGGTTVPVTGSGLTVSLASSNPASATIVADSTGGNGAQSLVPFVTLRFTNTDASDVKVTSIKFTRSGISADTDISQAYLMSGLAKLAEYQSFNSSVITFSDPSGLFMVAAGGTKEVTLRADLVNGASSGKTIAFTATEVTSDASSVSGTPVAGNVMSTAQTDDLGKLTVANVTDPSGSVDPQEDFEVLSFSLAAATQDINVEKLTVTNIGSTSASDIENLKLYDGADLISEVASMTSDKTVTFDLSASPLKITKGVTKNMSLRADLNGGTNRTFQFQFQYMTDILAKDTQYGVYVKPNQLDSWTIIGASTYSTLTTGSLTLSKSSDAPSGNIAMNGIGVTIAKFDIKAVGEDVKITSLVTGITGTVSTDGLDQGAIFFDEVQKGQTTNLNTADNAAGASTTSFTFGNTLVVPAGETKTLEIRANIDKAGGTDWSGNETLTPSIVSVTATGKSSSQTVSSVSQTGNELTIKAGTLSASLNNAQPSWTVSNPTGVAGVNNVLIGSFIITAGSSEGAKITALKLQDTSDLFTDVQNVKVYKGTLASGTQIGSTRGSVSAGSSYTFYASPYVTLSASEQIVVNVYADIKTGVSAGAQGSVDLNYVYGTGAVTNTSINYVTEVTGQTVYVSGNGTLTVAEDAANPSSAQVIMGTTGVDMLKAKLTASAEENMNVTQVVVTATLGSDTPTSTVRNIKLYDGTTQVGSTISSLVDAGTATFDLTANPFVVPGGQNKVLTVKADINTYLNATSSGTVALGLVSAAVTSKGAVSSVSGGTSGAVSGSDMYTYKTVVTVDEGQTASVIRSNDTELLYFTVTNNGDYDAYLNSATFTVYYLQGNGNATTSATRTFNLYKSTDGYNTAVGTVDLVADTAIGSASPIVITPGTAVAIAAGQTVTFKLKGDLSDCGVSTGSTTGSTIKFYINSGSDLDWDDGVSASIASTYTEDFPVNGPLTQF